MKAKLIAKTSGASQELSEASLEQIMAWTCRVSGDQRVEDSTKILMYCLRHGHFSVFETCSLTIEIETSLAIFAQVARHRSFTFQVLSRRYNGDDIEFEPAEMRLKAKGGNRQGSDAEVDSFAEELAYQTITETKLTYEKLTEEKIAPECARMVLPQCTQTKAYMTGNVRSWIFYFTQRLDDHAQKEHRELAQEMFEIFKEQCPNIAWFIENHTQIWERNNPML